MGLTESAPAGAKIFRACEKNDAAKLQALISALQRRNPNYDRSVLSWVDKFGRTPLIVCARDNRHICARVVRDAGTLAVTLACMSRNLTQCTH